MTHESAMRAANALIGFMEGALIGMQHQVDDAELVQRVIDRLPHYADNLRAALAHQRTPSADTEHRQGCDALGGYGHGIGPCTCRDAARAAESEAPR